MEFTKKMAERVMKMFEFNSRGYPEKIADKGHAANISQEAINVLGLEHPLIRQYLKKTSKGEKFTVKEEDNE